MDLSKYKPDNLQQIQMEKNIEVVKVIETPVGNIRVQPKKPKGIVVPKGGFVLMDDHQKENAAILCQTLFAGGMSITPEELYKVWPTRGVNAKLAGARPEVHDLANYMASDSFATEMANRGVDWEDSDVITPEQMATVQYMSVNTGSILSKLRKCGVTTAQWNSWKRQRKFMEYYKSVMESQLKDSVPEMKAALANRAIEGDVNAIKFAMEVTGEYNPNYKSAVDAQAFVGIVIDAILEEVDDIDLRNRLQSNIALKAQALRGMG